MLLLPVSRDEQRINLAPAPGERLVCRLRQRLLYASPPALPEPIFSCKIIVLLSPAVNSMIGLDL
jgi:hypothetical protein